MPHPLPLRFFGTAWDNYARTQRDTETVPKFLVDALAAASAELLAYLQRSRQDDERVISPTDEPIDFWGWANGLSAPSVRSRIRHGLDVAAWMRGSAPIETLTRLARPFQRRYKRVLGVPQAIDVLFELGHRLPHIPAVRALSVSAAISADRMDLAMWLARDRALDQGRRLQCIHDCIDRAFHLRWVRWLLLRGHTPGHIPATLLLLSDAAALGNGEMQRRIARSATALLEELATSLDDSVVDNMERAGRQLDEQLDAERLFATVFGMCWAEADYVRLGTALDALRRPSAVDRCLDEMRRHVKRQGRDTMRRAITSMLLHDALAARRFAGRLLIAGAIGTVEAP